MQRQDWWASCRPDTIISDTVVLSTARRLPVLPCPAPLNTAGSLAGRAGVSLGAGNGPLSGSARSGQPCLTRHRVRLCPLTAPPADGALLLQVNLPGHPAAALLEIGLSGDGSIARTILDSVRSG